MNGSGCSDGLLFPPLSFPGLPYDTNEVALKGVFSQHGDIIQVKVICHPVTGRTKGYGFVRFSLEKEVAATLEKMSDAVLDGRTYGCISQTVDDLLLETGFRPAL
uniref:RRM domain-containing protein n=1 Tax=Hordeum vulgare subsp. vulgare TaxID=112509 RepID=A0A8I6XDL4_HORVV